MQKIISLFQRNYDSDYLVRDEVVPGAEWVLAGEGVATRKWDGTCCRIKDGKLYKRHDVKKGKAIPVGFEPAQEHPDPITGHWPGWLAVGDGPEDRIHRETFADKIESEEGISDGTYELVGKDINGNSEGMDFNCLVPHGLVKIFDPLRALDPRTFDELKLFFEDRRFKGEGIVWHHPDGRMVKIKRRDFFKVKKSST